MRWEKVAALAMLLATSLEGASVWTHVWVGTRPEVIDLWRQPGPLQDVAFADAVERGANWLANPDDWFVRKFYMIGLTLPDMFDSTAQKVIQDLVDYLADFAWLAGGPLDVQNVTLQQTRSKITFQGLPPNQNFEKLRQMVIYAQQHGFSNLEKALIYGMYVHLLEDYVAHMNLQPSLYGYGTTVDPPPSLERNWLEVMELFYELLAPTWIPDGDWPDMVLDVYSVYIYNTRDCNPESVIKGVRKPSGFQFYARANQEGLCPGEQLWQNHPGLAALHGLVNAMQGVGYGSNLTYEKLRAYMWGWGVLNFLVGGFRYTDISGTAGGPFRHPEWTLADIKDWFVGLGDENFHLSIEIDPDNPIANVIADIFASIVNVVLGMTEEVINAFGVGWVTVITTLLGIDQLATAALDYAMNVCGLNMSWVEFLSDTTYVDQFVSCLGYVGVDVNSPRLMEMREYVRWWQLYGSQRKPMLRNSYQREMARWEDLFGELRAARDRSPQEIHYRDNNWEISRKSGVLGGFWDVPNNRVIEQPGVFRLDFRRYNPSLNRAKLRYTNTPIYVEDSRDWRKEVWLNYDLIAFGPTRVYVKPTSDTSVVLDSLDFRSTGRYQAINPQGGWNYLRVNVAGWLAPGGPPARRDTLFWEVRTADSLNPSNFHPMMKSDYREPYTTRPEIHNNVFYQTFFKDGNPVREPGEDPLQDPKHYWPYVLPVEPRLNAPGNPQLTITASGLSFTWEDRSSYETRYNVTIRAIPWSGNTVYAQGHKIAGQDTTSGFLSWNDLFWAWGYLEFSWPILYLELVSKMRQG